MRAPSSDQLYDPIICIYSTRTHGRTQGTVCKRCWFHEDENNNFAVLHYIKL